MNHHVDPLIEATLNNFWPVPLAPGTPTEEAELVRCDIALQRNREQFNDNRALDLQIQQMREAGL